MKWSVSVESVSVERNVVFNDDDTVDATAVIPGNLSEGKDKISQVPKMLTSSAESSMSKNQPEDMSKDQNGNKPQNSVPFPVAPEPTDTLPPDESGEDPDKEPKHGRGHHVAKKLEGVYTWMHNTLPLLEANAVVLCNPDDKIDGIGVYALDDNNELSDMLPPDFATVGAMESH